MGISHSYSYGGVVETPRSKILDLEAMLMAQDDNLTPEEAEDKYITHHFAPGTYTRTMVIPAGLCIVGKIHRHAHINVVSYGRLKVVTEFGDEIIVGPKVWVSEPGTKRALVSLEDSLWTTIHANPNDLRDTDALEAEIIAPDFETFDRLRVEQGNIL